MLELFTILSQLTAALIAFGLPAWIFTTRPRNGSRNWRLRFLLSVLAVWIGSLLHRFIIGLPVFLAHAARRGDFASDGVGTTVQLLLLGWIPGIIYSALVLGAYRIIQRYQAQKASPPSNTPQ